MPIPDDRLPEFEDSLESDEELVAGSDSLEEEDELEFESSDADNANDEMLDPDEESVDAGFGYGDPAD